MMKNIIMENFENFPNRQPNLGFRLLLEKKNLLSMNEVNIK
jgi:hypothetical protein